MRTWKELRTIGKRRTAFFMENPERKRQHFISNGLAVVGTFALYAALFSAGSIFSELIPAAFGLTATALFVISFWLEINLDKQRKAAGIP